jgi:hypothetical protein
MELRDTDSTKKKEMIEFIFKAIVSYMERHSLATDSFENYDKDRACTAAYQSHIEAILSGLGLNWHVVFDIMSPGGNILAMSSAKDVPTTEGGTMYRGCVKYLTDFLGGLYGNASGHPGVDYFAADLYDMAVESNTTLRVPHWDVATPKETRKAEPVTFEVSVLLFSREKLRMYQSEIARAEECEANPSTIPDEELLGMAVTNFGEARSLEMGYQIRTCRVVHKATALEEGEKEADTKLLEYWQLGTHFPFNPTEADLRDLEATREVVLRYMVDNSLGTGAFNQSNSAPNEASEVIDHYRAILNKLELDTDGWDVRFTSGETFYELTAERQTTEYGGLLGSLTCMKQVKKIAHIFNGTYNNVDTAAKFLALDLVDMKRLSER